MRIKVRRVMTHYAEVIIEDQDIKINLGLLDVQQQKELKEHLLNVADDLEDGFDSHD